MANYQVFEIYEMVAKHCHYHNERFNLHVQVKKRTAIKQLKIAAYLSFNYQLPYDKSKMV